MLERVAVAGCGLAIAVLLTAASGAAQTPVAPAADVAPDEAVDPGKTDPNADPLAPTADSAPAELTPSPDERTTVVADAFPTHVEHAPAPTLSDVDLAPAFEAEPWATARQLFEAGRYSDALAKMPERSAVTASRRYLRALAQYRAGAFEAAGNAFTDLADDYAVLADRCHHYAGLAFEEGGALTRAAEAYRQVPEASLLYKEARKNLGRVLRQSGQLTEAIAALAPLAEKPAPVYGWDFAGDYLYAVAGLQEALGDKKAARDSYLALFSAHPINRYADSALAHAKALGGEPTPEQLTVRGEILMEAHRNARAIALLEPIVSAPPATMDPAYLCRAQFALGKAMRKNRQHAQAVTQLERVIAGCEDKELVARALYVAGTSASYVMPERAVELYRQLAHDYPDHPFADDALFNVGDILVRLGRNDEARVALQTLGKIYGDGDFRAEGLFRLFWLERTEGRLEKALKTAERIATDYEGAADTSDYERAAYWKARTLLDLSRTAAATNAFEALSVSHPASYYGMLARSRLKELAPERADKALAKVEEPVGAPAQKSLAVGRLWSNPHFAAGLELLRLGFKEAAAEELMSIDRAALRSARDDDAMRAIVLLLDKVGEVRAAHAVARTELRRDLSGRFTPENLAVYKVAYPLAFRELIVTHTGEAGLEPDILQALMREESALDPRVQSWAGAVGLCQLMVPTAMEVMRDLGIKGRATAERLTDPDLNIRLGATYLAKLQKRFKNNVALSLAAYNAGGGAVSGWINRSSTRDLDAFVEEIPIAETRNYVKRVLRTYNTYRLLYGDPNSVKAATLGQTLVARAEAK